MYCTIIKLSSWTVFITLKPGRWWRSCPFPFCLGRWIWLLEENPSIVHAFGVWKHCRPWLEVKCNKNPAMSSVFASANAKFKQFFFLWSTENWEAWLSIYTLIIWMPFEKCRDRLRAFLLKVRREEVKRQRKRTIFGKPRKMWCWYCALEIFHSIILSPAGVAHMLFCIIL